MSFQLQSNYKPRGDQEQAIAKLLKSVEAGNRYQTLLRVTGLGKTFTIANVIQELDRHPPQFRSAEISTSGRPAPLESW
jgi:excinuclease ABC subunit B